MNTFVWFACYLFVNTWYFINGYFDLHNVPDSSGCLCPLSVLHNWTYLIFPARVGMKIIKVGVSLKPCGVLGNGKLQRKNKNSIKQSTVQVTSCYLLVVQFLSACAYDDIFNGDLVQSNEVTLPGYICPLMSGSNLLQNSSFSQNRPHRHCLSRPWGMQCLP